MMKTTVSLPDDIFRSAEKLAAQLEISRSELYGRALGEYVARHAPAEVTEALDRLVDELAGESHGRSVRRGPDSAFAARAARRLLRPCEW
jgi:predicted transcriptional regulator